MKRTLLAFAATTVSILAMVLIANGHETPSGRDVCIEELRTLVRITNYRTEMNDSSHDSGDVPEGYLKLTVATSEGHYRGVAVGDWICSWSERTRTTLVVTPENYTYNVNY